MVPQTVASDALIDLLFGSITILVIDTPDWNFPPPPPAPPDEVTNGQ